MIATPTPGALKNFRRTPWRFQQTVELSQSACIEEFASLIIQSHPEITGGTVTVDEVVFDTDRLGSICPVSTIFERDCSVMAQTREELYDLFVAALGDGLDFLCTPSPKPFCFYSDHDDWVTFYANTKSHLNHVIGPLASHGYRLIDWQRNFSSRRGGSGRRR